MIPASNTMIAVNFVSGFIMHPITITGTPKTIPKILAHNPIPDIMPLY